MKKKGFTLVELLAVIAILAILVIIALPNVMGMFNQAKQNSFTTEIKEIFKQAEQQWISDSMMNTTSIDYYRYTKDGTVTNKAQPSTAGERLTNESGIKLTGRTQLDYFITINKAGKITKYYATDGSYQYYYDGDGLNVEDIGSGTTGNNQVVQVSTITANSTNFVCVGGSPVDGVHDAQGTDKCK